MSERVIVAVSGLCGMLALVGNGVNAQESVRPEAPMSPMKAESVVDRFNALWPLLHTVDQRGDPVGMAVFLSVPEEAVAFFSQRIRPAKKPMPGEVEALIAELGSADFARRTKASAALEKWHRLARPAVQSAQYKKLSLEMQRRLELLINKMDDISRCPEILRQKNVVWILYKINTPSARKLLREWSMGAPEAYLTREARDRLESLEKPTR